MNSIQNISIEEDTHLNLTVKFSHSIIKIQWFLNDTPVEKLSLNYTYPKENNQALLMIDNVSKRHHGRYKVKAWDVLNQTNQSIIFTHVYLLRKHTELKIGSLIFSLFFLAPQITRCSYEEIRTTLDIYILCRFEGKKSEIIWYVIRL
jgi:hypothetical protein